MNPIKVVDYEKGTGRILRTIQYPDPQEATSLYPGCLYLPVETDTHDVHRYVVDGWVMDRPESPAYLEGLTLRGVQAGAEIFIDGQAYEADGTDIELEFDHPGVYSLRVVCWPYLDKELTYEN